MISKTGYEKFFGSRSFWRKLEESMIFGQKITKATRQEIIDKLWVEITEKKYYPSTPIRYLTFSKGHSVVRTVPVFSLTDYCLYFYCLSRIERKIAINRTENTFGGWSLGGAIRKSEDSELEIKSNVTEPDEEPIVSNVSTSYNPNAWSRAFGQFNAILYPDLTNGEFSYAVEFDIANFYDCIRLDLLERSIKEIAEKDEAEEVSLLFHFLNYWNRHVNFYNAQSVGLPQDALADCSRILANFYLQDYDKYISEEAKKLSCKYLRYADDQFLLGNNLKDLESLVFLASKKLNSIGLNINQKKVEVWENLEDLKQHRSYDLFEIVRDENRYSPLCIHEFIEEVLKINFHKNKLKNRGISLLNKALFLNLSNLPRKTKKQIDELFLEDFFLRQLNSSKMKKLFKVLTKSRRKKLVSKLKELSKETLYTSFHYALIDFFRTNYKVAKNKEIALIEKRILEIDSM